VDVVPPLAHPAPVPRARRPWWIPHFLGAVPEIAPEKLRLLGVVALALFFEQYDFGMLSNALPRIALDLGIERADYGRYLSLVRLGALPAFALLALADRIGRRRLFLLCVVVLSLGTAATALAQTPVQFVAIQMLTRTFMTAGMAIAFVIVTEEFPAEHRGWGLGVLGALGAIGIGLGAGLFAAVDVLPYGWRALYAFGLFPLVLIPTFRRSVPETRRFHDQVASQEAKARARGVFATWLGPIVDLARAYPARAGLVALISFATSFGTVSVFQFTSDFLLRDRGWAPWQFSLMLVLGGALGIVGNVSAGRLGDRVGRRGVGMASMAAFPAFVSLFYLGPSASLTAAWIGFLFCVSMNQTIQRAFATELFPTRERGTAMGLAELVSTLGASAGLALVGVGIGLGWPLAQVTSAFSFAVAGAGLFVLLLPETRGRELEAISDAGRSDGGEVPHRPRREH
jgi:AAHS family benzoate transporter-like MFS transporter